MILSTTGSNTQVASHAAAYPPGENPVRTGFDATGGALPHLSQGAIEPSSDGSQSGNYLLA